MNVAVKTAKDIKPGDCLVLSYAAGPVKVERVVSVETVYDTKWIDIETADQRVWMVNRADLLLVLVDK